MKEDEEISQSVYAQPMDTDSRVVRARGVCVQGWGEREHGLDEGGQKVDKWRTFAIMSTNLKNKLKKYMTLLQSTVQSN